MFTPDIKVSGGLTYDLDKYIEGDDIFNSKFIKYFMRLPIKRVHTITRFEERIDLLSMSIYGREDLSNLILLFNNKNILDLKIGESINLFSLMDLDNLIKNLNDL